MSKFEKWVLKERSIWFHIVLSLFTYGIWVIVYFVVKFLQKNKSEQESYDNYAIENNLPKLVDELSFNVAGTTFENRQEKLKKIINDKKKFYDIELYDGMTNREIIEYGEDVYEVNDVKFSTLRLNPTEFEGKDAIEVYVKVEEDSKELLIGYCPKSEIKHALDFIEKCNNNSNYNLFADAYIIGGKFKTVEYDDEKDKEIVVVDEKNYGVYVTLKLYDK